MSETPFEAELIESRAKAWKDRDLLTENKRLRAALENLDERFRTNDETIPKWVRDFARIALEGVQMSELPCIECNDKGVIWVDTDYSRTPWKPCPMCTQLARVQAERDLMKERLGGELHDDHYEGRGSCAVEFASLPDITDCFGCLLRTAEAERDALKRDKEMADGCLTMIAELLSASECMHGKDHGRTPPMMYPEWIVCVVSHRAEAAEAERDALLRERLEDWESYVNTPSGPANSHEDGMMGGYRECAAELRAVLMAGDRASSRTQSAGRSPGPTWPTWAWWSAHTSRRAEHNDAALGSGARVE